MLGAQVVLRGRGRRGGELEHAGARRGRRRGGGAPPRGVAQGGVGGPRGLGPPRAAGAAALDRLPAAPVDVPVDEARGRRGPPQLHALHVREGASRAAGCAERRAARGRAGGGRADRSGRGRGVAPQAREHELLFASPLRPVREAAAGRHAPRQGRAAAAARLRGAHAPPRRRRGVPPRLLLLARAARLPAAERARARPAGGQRRGQAHQRHAARFDAHRGDALARHPQLPRGPVH
mmetsp:Transcript_21532/g.49473  ORF Transcript_21532/g.49473 Transcript_21532/m.49473 type:complete len:236 (+) Transcript_21532:492-1199(+)